MVKEILRYKPTVLVVDDDENIISAFEDFFRREYCIMLSASSMEQALKIISTQSPDLLITDIRLKDQSGITFFLKFKAMFKDVPVIVMTGYPESITEKEVLALGAEVLLLKPLELNKLRQAVRSCLHLHDV
ncbi:MAG: response regulator [Bacteroidota bacterium]